MDLSGGGGRFARAAADGVYRAGAVGVDGQHREGRVLVMRKGGGVRGVADRHVTGAQTPPLVRPPDVSARRLACRDHMINDHSHRDPERFLLARVEPHLLPRFGCAGSVSQAVAAIRRRSRR